MIFSSISFLYYFLPITIALYFLFPKSLKNIVLLFSSLVFYGWGEPKYLLLMGISILFGYGFGLLVEKYREKKVGKIFCALSVSISLSFLLYFKYANFFVTNFNLATGFHLPILQVTLPIGISFYTFQMISYTIDVYRGEDAQKNIFSLATYIAMFPQLIAGPIVRYSDIAKQIKTRTHSFDMAAEGIRRFIFGLAKKILLANQLGELCSIFLDSLEKSVLFYWLYAISFGLQIYFDFSGYSDMAIGLGKIFGFHLLENFHYPFISTSITEFWRRWHISLGSWFRDYVYIPLGGNQKGKSRQFFNIFMVWILTGFWHGAAWNYILWGLYFAVLLSIEKLYFVKRPHDHSGMAERRYQIFSRIYVLFFVTISFMIFNGQDLGQVCSDIGGLFGIGGIPFVSDEALYCLRSFAVVLLIAIIGATPFACQIVTAILKRPMGKRILNWIEPVVLILLLLIMTAYLVDGSFNPFLYFRF